MRLLRVAVTGGAGFLGSSIAYRAAQEGVPVCVFVRPRTRPRRLKRIHPGLLLQLTLNLSTLSTRVGMRKAVESLEMFRADVVVHAAWRGVRGADRDDPAQTDNIAHALALLDATRRSGVKRFVALGSQAEYGPKDGPISETTPTTPTTAYGAAKLACGQRVLERAGEHGISAAWIRVFSVYGPGQLKGALIPDLARALLQGTVPPLGDGTGPWDFLYEEDAADAIVRLAQDPDLTGIYNLASGRAVPLRDVMHRVRDLTAPGLELPLGTRQAPPGETTRLEADVTRLVKAIGFSPRVDLDTGLARTVAALREA